jgi:chaperone required for assembly of F1-ATPase
MPLTGLANAAIDRIAPDPATFAAGLARYAESDLLCYRADAPEDLIARQIAAWDPLLDWARQRYDIHFTVVTSIMHVAQPPLTLTRLADAVAARDAFALAGLSPLVTTTGSLIAALALAEKAFTPDQIWQASQIDETWQAERWGIDADAARVTALARADFDAGVAFLSAL